LNRDGSKSEATVQINSDMQIVQFPFDDIAEYVQYYDGEEDED
jgi:hypothetical protein